ncbi:hypothetical protein ILYODFUR_031136 [Ilyodon furcidens]|uniref:Uncharacterized protein n=1 Tax=Ilyodon furcidens TaxID=33524 RepID=A0ABV0SSU7_9TELE
MMLLNKVLKAYLSTSFKMQTNSRQDVPFCPQENYKSRKIPSCFLFILADANQYHCTIRMWKRSCNQIRQEHRETPVFLSTQIFKKRRQEKESRFCNSSKLADQNFSPLLNSACFDDCNVVHS